MLKHSDEFSPGNGTIARMEKPRRSPPVSEGFIRRLELLMGEQGLNRQSLSLKMGRHAGYIRDIFEQHKAPNIMNAIDMARVLGVSVGWLVNGEGGREPQQPDTEEGAALDAIRGHLAAARVSMRQDVSSFARLVGIEDYEAYEVGRRPLTLWRLMQICERAGLSLDHVCYGDTGPSTETLPEDAVGTRTSRGRAPGSGSTQFRTKSAE